MKSGICGDILIKRKGEIVISPYEDFRFNGTVDISTSIPIYAFPVIEFDV